MTQAKTRRTIFSTALAATAGTLLAPVSRAGAPANCALEFIFDRAPYPQCHASTLVETSDGAIAAAWFGGTEERNPDVCIWFARRDADGWQAPAQVADGVREDGMRFPTWNPVLFQDPNGPLLLFYKVGPSPAEWWGMVIASTDGGRHWVKPRRLPDGILGPIKNKPVITRDDHWLAPSSTERNDPLGTTGWHVHFEKSRDRGATWERGNDLDSELKFEAIQPTILKARDGRLQAVCRTRQGVLAATWSHDDGQTWSGLSAIDLPNPNSGIDGVSLADGRHLLVYNHAAHFAETPAAGPRYPINLALSDDGVSWRSVMTLESEPLGEGYAYPAVIQSRDGLVHISYTWDRKRIRYVALDPLNLA